MSIVNILNTSIHNFTLDELLYKLSVYGGVVVTPNVDHLVKLQKDEELLQAYHLSTYRLCDSKIVQYISKFLGNPIKEKISGSDLFPAFYEYNKDNEDIKIFLLGAMPGVAQKAQEKINQKVDREIIVDCYSPSFGFEKNELECQQIIDRINQSGATVLAVGLGAPKQEKWIAKYKKQLKNIKIFLAIGATIDFEAGYKPRSPKWMSNIGLEWFYRLASEPRRLWKRYLVESLPLFWLVLQQKLNWYKNHPELLLPILPLGQLLEKAGLISEEQIKNVVELQQEIKGDRFGDVIVNLGWLKQETVNFFAEELRHLLVKKEDLMLGEYLKSAHLLTNEQIDEILKEQQQTGIKFGEIAMKKGWVKQDTLDLFLSLQPNNKPEFVHVIPFEQVGMAA